MAFFHYSHSKALKLAISIVVLLILFPALFRILFAAQDEISYGAGAGLSTCSEFFAREESDLSVCTTSYNIAIGNTGSNHQEIVTIEVASVPNNRRVNWRVLDIVASKRRPIGPRVTNQQLGDTLQFEIQDLEPNRMVEISIYSQGLESAEQMENISVKVAASGSVIETNPRTTIALRFLRNLGGFFGF